MSEPTPQWNNAARLTAWHRLWERLLRPAPDRKDDTNKEDEARCNTGT